MTTLDERSAEEIKARLAQFLKPSHMPVTPAQLNAWIEEAAEAGGEVEVSRHWTLSGATEQFSL